ncbi:MAG: aminoglycoside phosphotransferase family protein [Anaerolineae bacterium]|nr:aminoglycoside phosphotransferase family protein [Anaerolineae bacterium]
MIGRALRAVAAAHEAQQVEMAVDGCGVRRIAGGNNNALYRVDVDGGSLACKLCVDDGRQRAEREYANMRLLCQVGLDIAPEPLRLDTGCALLPFPTVVYRWLDGEPIRPPVSAQQLAALLRSFQQMHDLSPSQYSESAVMDAFFHWFAYAPYLADLNGFLDLYGPWLASLGASDLGGGLTERALLDRMRRLVDGCAEMFAKTDVDPGREYVAMGLCRVDANLANTVWGRDGTARWVDWEFSGWGDLAFDLADLRWHAAWEGVSEPEHAWFREHYCRPADDPAFDARLTLWDRLISTRWPLLVLRALWSKFNGPDRQRLSQVQWSADELWARMVRLLERAEQVAGEEGG